jgi:predicted aspartyl protease
VHAATILWNGSEQDVEIIATGERPLLGTELLDGHELVIQFSEGGHVSIDAL